MGEVAEDLGIAIANLVNLFNPALVVLDQRLHRAGEEFLSLISQVIRRQALASSAATVSLGYARLGPEAGLLGLGLRILDEYFAQRTQLRGPEPAVKKPARAAARGKSKANQG